MPILASKIRKGQPLTSERRDRDNFLKGKCPTSSQSDLPSPAHCLSPEGQGHREGGGSQIPGDPHTSDRQRVRRANLPSLGSSV